MMTLKQIDRRTWSFEGRGVIAVIASNDAYRWARLFANAEELLVALKGLLAFCEDIVTLDGFNPEEFHVIRAAQEAIAAAEGGGV